MNPKFHTALLLLGQVKDFRDPNGQSLFTVMDLVGVQYNGGHTYWFQGTVALIK